MMVTTTPSLGVLASSAMASVTRSISLRFCSMVRPFSMVIWMEGIASSLFASRRLPGQLVAGKKITELEPRRIVGVSSVDGIALDRLRPFLPHCAGFSVSRIRGAHQRAQVGDGVFFLQGQHYDRTAGHEAGERIEKRTAGVNRIKTFRLLLGDLQHLHADDAEALLLDHI